MNYSRCQPIDTLAWANIIQRYRQRTILRANTIILVVENNTIFVHLWAIFQFIQFNLLKDLCELGILLPIYTQNNKNTLKIEVSSKKFVQNSSLLLDSGKA
jgi:hypothetical protein